MSEMSPAEAVFFAALERTDPAARAAYLDEACAGQPELGARVEKPLAAHPKAQGFLDPADDRTGVRAPCAPILIPPVIWLIGYHSYQSAGLALPEPGQ